MQLSEHGESQKPQRAQRVPLDAGAAGPGGRTAGPSVRGDRAAFDRSVRFASDRSVRRSQELLVRKQDLDGRPAS